MSLNVLKRVYTLVINMPSFPGELALSVTQLLWTISRTCLHTGKMSYQPNQSRVQEGLNLLHEDIPPDLQEVCVVASTSCHLHLTRRCVIHVVPRLVFTNEMYHFYVLPKLSECRQVAVEGL
jgi:hypothetical protein